MKEKIILLVDADADCAGMVLEAGEQTGHGVRLSRDGAEAFGFLNREFDCIDCLIVDVDQGSHGMALLTALCTLWRRLPVIVVTGSEESHMKAAVLRLGADACLGKPLSIERLRAVIDSFVRSERDQEISCDPWGHPCGRDTEVERTVHA
jgi:DNA-binding response OmpR family regulator